MSLPPTWLRRPQTHQAHRRGVKPLHAPSQTPREAQLQIRYRPPHGKQPRLRQNWFTIKCPKSTPALKNKSSPAVVKRMCSIVSITDGFGRRCSIIEARTERPRRAALGLREDGTENARVKLEGRHILSADLCVSPTVLGQEGQSTLKLDERITQMYDELHEPVYRYLLCRSASAVDADDIIQETFLRLYLHLNAGGREDNMRGWVFRVAHNISINELKKRKHLFPIAPED